MEKCEVGRKSTRTVPVIIENHENHSKKTKLMVPSNYTAGHLVNVLRSRMHLLPYHPVYLFLKSKQSPVLMSKIIGHLHRKHRDDKGLLRLIHADQASFGFRGNIRAIRFRQKWIENLHNTLHQDAASSNSGTNQLFNSGGPPPYFPLEPPSIANFGAPLDLDDINDSVVQLTDHDDYYDYMASSFMLEMEDSLSEISPNDDPNPWHNNLFDSSSESSVSTISSESSSSPSTIDWPHSSGSFLDPWLPASTTNSSQSTSTSHPFVIINAEDDIQEIEQAAQNVFSASTSGNLAPSVPNVSLNNQTTIAQNLQGPPNLSLYESDSDFYDSDKDEDMEK